MTVGRRILPYLAAAILAAPLAAQTDLEKPRGEPELWLLDKVIQQAVRRVRPSVVTVETFGGFRKVLGRPRSPRSQPSRPKPKPKNKKKKPLGPIKMPGFIQAQGPSTGLVIGRDGLILTSRFALAWDPSTILVTLDDGRRFPAERLGEDRSRGLALLRVDAHDLPVPDLVPADQIEVGQWAFAVARSFGPKAPTVHAGMVSAVGRIQGRAVQTDASTSPANYGGPLIDLEGRVIGLVTPLSPAGDLAGANWYDSGIGFAATLADIHDKIEGMKRGEVYDKAFLGVAMDPGWLGPGAKVASTTKKSPAQHANIRKGDRILEVDGVAVRHAMHLQDLIGRHVAGDWVELAVERKDKTQAKVLVQLDAR